MSTSLRIAPTRHHPMAAHLGPNWFASVMGTGVVATAAATLPASDPVLDVIALVAWTVASLLLTTLLVVTAAHWTSRPGVARGHLDDPVMSHFYGAPAMALMTVGTATLLVGVDVVGPGAALIVDALLWSAGTALGLWTLCAIPRRTLARGAGYSGAAFGGWLMPVVPPMVSASAGALLIPDLPEPARRGGLALCAVMFAVALAASAPLLAIVVRRTLAGRLGAPLTVPTLAIVLGPLGQSATAAHLLGDLAGGPWRAVARAYAVPVLVAAFVWLVVVACLAARTARTGLPFGLTWWSFTFPVGTVVTGTSGLALGLRSSILTALAVALFVVLVAAWALVAALTVRATASGALLAPPQTP